MMKKLILIAFISTFWGCTQQEYIVGSDWATETDLTDYDSFDFASQVTTEDGVFTLNDLNLKHQIREAIEHEMEANGYSKVPQEGDLLVNFRIFDKPTEYIGYEDQGNYWQGHEVRQGERRTYQLEAGTLMVDIIDRNTGQLVWTGYASGIIEGDSFDRREESIAMAVDNIFDQLE